jgi:hypothetical protein
VPASASRRPLFRLPGVTGRPAKSRPSPGCAETSTSRGPTSASTPACSRKCLQALCPPRRCGAPEGCGGLGRPGGRESDKIRLNKAAPRQRR